MNKNNAIIEEIKQKLLKHKSEIKNEFYIKEIGIFGSYLNGTQTENSDLDILVDFKKNAILSLIDIISLENKLKDLLRIRVDLVEKKQLKPAIGKRILKEVIYI